MIQNKAVIVRFSVSSYTARKKDKAQSARIEKENDAKAGVASVNKRLVSKESIDAYKDVEGRARSYHYEKTLPWSDNGDRLLPVALVPEYTARMQEFKAEFEEAARVFCFQFPELVQEAVTDLGSMFRRDDFPEQYAISSKFGFEFSFSPVPESGHLVIDAAQEVVEEMRAGIAESVRLQERRAVRDINERIFQVVAELVERLSKSDAIFRDSLIGNVQEVLNVTGALNFDDDESITALRVRLADMLQGLEPETLRQSRRIREGVANQARLVLDDVGARVGRQCRFSYQENKA